MIGTTHEDDPGEDAEHPEDRHQDGGPAGEPTAFEERHQRIEPEREEQRRADVEQDRGQTLHTADDEQADADAERRKQRDPERVVDLHGNGSRLSRAVVPVWSGY
ncbi:hypothetical protein QE430_002340 [Microbacterium testaceum]|nr:hypothetical protein [Microbacterium testaceum]